MVLLVLCKKLYLLENIVCYIKPKIIVYKVCDVNSIPANLRNPKTLDNLPKFPGFYQIFVDKSIQSSICYF